MGQHSDDLMYQEIITASIKAEDYSVVMGASMMKKMILIQLSVGNVVDIMLIDMK